MYHKFHVRPSKNQDVNKYIGLIFESNEMSFYLMAKDNHFWVEECNWNRKIAEEIWSNKTNGYDLNGGVTIFNNIGPNKGESLEDQLITIYEHHGHAIPVRVYGLIEYVPLKESAIIDRIQTNEDYLEVWLKDYYQNAAQQMDASAPASPAG